MGVVNENARERIAMSPLVVAGYEARPLGPVVVAALAAALLVNDVFISRGAIIFCSGLCVIVHEALRSFSTGFLGIGVLLVVILVNILKAAMQLVKRGLQPKFPGWSAAFELVHGVAVAVGSTYGHTVIWLHNARSFRRNVDLFGRLQGWSSCHIYGVQQETFVHNGLEHIWLRSAKDGASNNTTKSKKTVVVLYYHGGGYTMLTPHVYVDFCNRLAHQIRRTLAQQQEDTATEEGYAVEVCLANYRKLPEVLFPVPADDALKMFDYVTVTKRIPARDVILAGDSAGAALVLSTMTRLRDAQREPPLLGIASCPYVDLSGDEEFAENCIVRAPIPEAIRQFSIAAAAVSTGGVAVDDPSSPLREAHAVTNDLSNLSPLLIQTGAFDLFHQHALRLAAKVEQDESEYELDVHAHMPHVFTVFPLWLLPGSAKGVDHMATFVAKHLGSSSATKAVHSCENVESNR